MLDELDEHKRKFTVEIEADCDMGMIKEFLERMERDADRSGFDIYIGNVTELASAEALRVI